MEKRNTLPIGAFFSYRTLSLLTAAFILVFQVFRAFNSPIWRDDAFFAVVAKNLVMGNGYSAVFFDGLHLFSFGISSGPTIILPTAFFISLFGNHYWVPAISSIAIIWLLLAAVFSISYKMLGPERNWTFCFFALLLGFIYSRGIGYFPFGIESGDLMAIWHLLLGEIPASLFVVLSVLTLAGYKGRRKIVIFSGLLMGLAVITKLLTAIAAFAVLSAFLFRLVLLDKRSVRDSIGMGLIFGICTLAPFFCFELVKFCLMGATAYFDMIVYTTEHYKANAIKTPANNGGPTGNTTLLFRHTGFLAYSGFFILLLCVFSEVKKRKLPDNVSADILWAGSTLFLCWLLHSLWWISLTQYMYRYISHAMLYLTFGLAIFISSPYIRHKGGKFLVIAVMITAFPLYKVSVYMLEKGFSKNEFLTYQQNALSALTELDKKQFPVLSCGINSELEYLLPGTGNFKDCNNQPEQKEILVNHYAGTGDKVLYIKHNSYKGRFMPLPDNIGRICTEQLLKNKEYSVSYCDFAKNGS